jgi:hypothetical protein
VLRLWGPDVESIRCVAPRKRTFSYGCCALYEYTPFCNGPGDVKSPRVICKIWYMISRTVSDDDAVLRGFGLKVGQVIKRLELLLQLMPEAVHIAVLVNPAAATTAETTLSDASVAAHAMGLKIQIVRANTNREIDSFEDFARERGFPRHIPFVILPKRVA